MTKKHFAAIAKAISETKFTDSEEKAEFINKMITILAALNPNFRFSTFREACYAVDN